MARTGIYRGNDDGYYYFRSDFATGRSGNCAWFGTKPGGSWANVFFGRWVLDGSIIRGMSGEWCDIPWSTASGHGHLTVDFHTGPPTPDWHRSSVSGGFGGSTWTQTQNLPSFPEISQGVREFSVESLTGVWQSDTGAMYYIRELPSQAVFWLAVRPDLSAIHVAKGERRENNIRVSWLDIPPSKVQSGGNLLLRITFDGLMAKESSSASFGSSRWVKLS